MGVASCCGSFGSPEGDAIVTWWGPIIHAKRPIQARLVNLVSDGLSRPSNNKSCESQLRLQLFTFINVLNGYNHFYFRFFYGPLQTINKNKTNN
jgi:hypothetical protein